MRKMASIQEILGIRPIEGADRIAIAEVLGWRVVIQIAENHKVGDKIVYFEVDSFLPSSDPRFASFQSGGSKTVSFDGVDVTGHALRTATFRKAPSQGLVMPISEFPEISIENQEVGTDVTNIIGIFQYEDPIPVGDEFIGRFDSRFTAKSDSPRIQGLYPYWDEIKELKWDATVKVDGSSVTVVNDNGKIRVFSRNNELEPKTCNQLRVAEKFGIVDVLNDNPGMAVQFEYAGPGVNANRLKLSSVQPFVFSVSVDGEKIGRDDWDERLLKNAVPLLGNEWNLENFDYDELIEAVSKLRGNIVKDKLDEGVVFHLASGQKTPWWMDRTKNFKVISLKYCLKHNV